MATIRLQSGKIEIPDPCDPALQKCWDAFPRIPTWIPPAANDRQIVVSIATEINAWFKSASRSESRNDIASAVRSAFNAAALGLVVGSTLDQCYFVPMEVDKKHANRRRTECQLWMGYQGYLELGYRSNYLSTVTPEVVLRDEKFDQWKDETGSHFRHEIPLDREFSMQNVVGAYVIVKTRDGSTSFTFVQGAELKKLGRRGNVWASHPIPMCHKTAILRSAKTWRKSSELAGAIKLDEQLERDEEQASLVQDQEPIEKPEVAAPSWAGDLNDCLEDAEGPADVEAIRVQFLERCETEDEQRQLSEFCEQWLEVMNLA